MFTPLCCASILHHKSLFLFMWCIINMQGPIAVCRHFKMESYIAGVTHIHLLLGIEKNVWNSPKQHCKLTILIFFRCLWMGEINMWKGVALAPVNAGLAPCLLDYMQRTHVLDMHPYSYLYHNARWAGLWLATVAAPPFLALASPDTGPFHMDNL